MLRSNDDQLKKSFEDESSDDRLLPDHDMLRTPKSRDLSRQKAVCLYGAGGLLALAASCLMAANVTLLWKQWTVSQNTNPAPKISPGSILNCGHSPEQARSLGCMFDVMDYSVCCLLLVKVPVVLIQRRSGHHDHVSRKASPLNIATMPHHRV